MKLNVVILDIKNKPVKNEDKEDVLISDLIVSALLNAEVKSDELHRKSKRFLIANKITNNVTKDMSKILKNSDKTEIMDAVKTISPPLVVGRIAEIIDPNSLQEVED